jgi:hypothetical protein
MLVTMGRRPAVRSLSAGRIRLFVTMIQQGDHIVVDWTGTDPDEPSQVDEAAE